jgi:ketosteroid isomerase-like protein
MRHRFGLLMVVMACWALPSAARAQGAQTRQELQRIYQQIQEGMKKRDLAPLNSHVAADFTERTVFGDVLDLKDAEARLKKNMQMTEAVRDFRLEVVQVVAEGDKALVLAKRHAAIRLKDPEGKLHEVIADGTGLDLWLKTPEGWKLRFADAIDLKMTLDGKPVTATRKQTSARPVPGVLALAQFYSTPYNYGWPGYGYSYGYGYSAQATNANTLGVLSAMAMQEISSKHGEYQQARVNSEQRTAALKQLEVMMRLYMARNPAPPKAQPAQPPRR